MCFDGIKRLCHIRGKLRKRQWINTSDIILVGLREYQDAKTWDNFLIPLISNSVSQTTTILFSKMTIPIMTRMRSRLSRTSRKSVTVKIATKVKPTISKKTLILCRI